MKLGGCVYLITNKNRSTLYCGVTSDLIKRIHEHKIHFHKGSFSDRYNLTILVYYEPFLHIEEAIAREKQIKAGSRKKKDDLINLFNPNWDDLYPKLITEL